jgi:hypothetical protein
MGDLDDRLQGLLERRRLLPASIAVMETHREAATMNSQLAWAIRKAIERIEGWGLARAEGVPRGLRPGG